MELPDTDLAEASHEELAALLDRIADERETVAAQQTHLILSARDAGMPQAEIARHLRITQAGVSKAEARARALSRGDVDGVEAAVGRLLAVADVIATRAQETGRSDAMNLVCKLFQGFRLTAIEAQKLGKVVEMDLRRLGDLGREPLRTAWEQAQAALGDPPGAIRTTAGREQMIFGYSGQHRALTSTD